MKTLNIELPAFYPFFTGPFTFYHFILFLLHFGLWSFLIRISAGWLNDIPLLFLFLLFSRSCFGQPFLLTGFFLFKIICMERKCDDGQKLLGWGMGMQA